MQTYPYTISNGAGEELTFLGIVEGPGGTRLEVEGRATPGAGPPMHVHFMQEEKVTVVTGRMGYQLAGGEPQFAGAGETGVFGAGVGHRWWNAGPGELHNKGWVSPPLNFEYFLVHLFSSMKQSGRNRPGIFDVAFLTRRYGSEFGMVGIPAPVRKVLFPIVVTAGKILGKYEKFKDAPEPVQATR